jgi:hypothetical protein
VHQSESRKPCANEQEKEVMAHAKAIFLSERASPGFIPSSKVFAHPRRAIAVRSGRAHAEDRLPGRTEMQDGGIAPASVRL